MWPVLSLVAFFSLLGGAAAANTCQGCLNKGIYWCVDSSSCLGFGQICKTVIRNGLNCPTTPQPGYEYTDDFGRKVAMPIIVAAGLTDPNICLKNAMPTVTLDKIHHSKCSEIGPNTTCHAYTAYDTVQKIIIISFRGTDTIDQLFEEFQSDLDKKEPFFDNGHVYKFFYDAFVMLWNQGLESSVRSLKYKYPDYDVWVMGHSLGGSLATVCASFMMKLGLATPEHTKLLTFGQPRTGDKDFAQWHDATFLYSYRVVHRWDIVPHSPALGGLDELWHHRYEIWYNNKMAPGDPYTLCQEEDGTYCSNLQENLSTQDHMNYFDKDMYVWAAEGCHQ